MLKNYPYKIVISVCLFQCTHLNYFSMTLRYFQSSADEQREEQGKLNYLPKFSKYLPQLEWKCQAMLHPCRNKTAKVSLGTGFILSSSCFQQLCITKFTTRNLQNTEGTVYFTMYILVILLKDYSQVSPLMDSLKNNFPGGYHTFLVHFTG